MTFGGAPAPNLTLRLLFNDGATWSTRATTTTGAGGRYNFLGAPALGPGQSYVVYFENTAAAPNPGPGYLWTWYANEIASYTAGASLQGGNFDVKDVVTALPLPGATVTLPAQFCWTPRGVASDTYRVAFYSPARDEMGGTNWLGNVGCTVIGALPPGWPRGESYRWWVRVGRGDPDAEPFNYGDAYYYSLVTVN